jgi:hypothetical protein
MKQLKSSLRDLREIFERSITVREIAEPLASFDVSCSIDEVINFIDDQDYDVVGVRKKGLICGYYKKSDLSGGKPNIINFQEKEKLPESTPLSNIFQKFSQTDQAERIFILFLGKVGGIVTRGDFQKIAIRMWLFGLISLIEMNLSRIIRDYYSDSNRWKKFISPKRIDVVEGFFKKYKNDNTAIDLIECLSLKDKWIIIKNDNDLIKQLAIYRTISNQFITKLIKIRNNLAHAHDIITGNWPDITDIVDTTEKFLLSCEEF